MENQKKKRKRMANVKFSTSFIFVQIGAQSTAGAKQQKMRMVPRVPNGKKRMLFREAVLRACADSKGGEEGASEFGQS